MITKDQIIQILPLSVKYIDKYYPFLLSELPKYGINSPLRLSAFIAQVGYESAQFKYVKEFASGASYERRLDLGNSSPGDGVKYKGRGLIQLTGKNNYISLMVSLGIDCIDHPELVELPENAVRSACWFWDKKSLNQLADKDSFDEITFRINGGYNGRQERYNLYIAAKKVLKC